MKLHYFIVILHTVVIVISFLFAMLYFKKEKPHYYIYIFTLIIIELLLSLNTIAGNNCIWLSGIKSRILIVQLIILIRDTLIGVCFWEFLRKTKFAKTIKSLLIFSFLCQIIIILIVQKTNTEIRPGSVLNLIILIFVFFYFRDLMINKPALILAESSSFWLTMGFFFSSCIIFPISCLIPFIPKTQEYSNLHYQIFSITNLALIVMYLLIIKSYLCLKHPQIL